MFELMIFCIIFDDVPKTRTLTHLVLTLLGQFFFRISTLKMNNNDGMLFLGEFLEENCAFFSSTWQRDQVQNGHPTARAAAYRLCGMALKKITHFCNICPAVSVWTSCTSLRLNFFTPQKITDCIFIGLFLCVQSNETFKLLSHYNRQDWKNSNVKQ